MKIIKFMLAGLLLLSVSACSQASTPSESFEDINAKYVNPVFQSGIVSTSWDQAESIPPDKLVAFYVYLKDYETDLQEYYNTLEVNDNFDPIETCDVIEKAVTAHFDITVDYMRLSSAYDSETMSCSLFGIGGLSNCKTVSSEQKGDKLLISYETFQGDKNNGSGTLAVRVTEDGYVYLSNKYTPK